MAAFYSFMFVLILIGIAWVGAGGAQLQTLFGVIIPYVAVAVFVVGFLSKIWKWASIPIPFCIPTTGGQQKSLPWIKWNHWDNPCTKGGTVIRMALEVGLFRSLFRNSKLKLQKDGPQVGYSGAPWLWLFAILFHYSFLVIIVRHLRLFTAPVPMLVEKLEFFDSILQIGVPTLYQTDLVILVAVLFLFARRVFDYKVKYISLTQDYFPLFLIIGIICSGMWMRYIAKVDVMAIKQLLIGVVTFHPVIPQDPINVTFYIHLFLVCTLFIYFPFSKLMHMGGVFLSPTRVVPNMSRRAMWVNPWNDPSVKPHSYEAYEDDFREKMIEAGINVDKQA